MSEDLTLHNLFGNATSAEPSTVGKDLVFASKTAVQEDAPLQFSKPHTPSLPPPTSPPVLKEDVERMIEDKVKATVGSVSKLANKVTEISQELGVEKEKTKLLEEVIFKLKKDHEGAVHLTQMAHQKLWDTTKEALDGISEKMSSLSKASSLTASGFSKKLQDLDSKLSSLKEELGHEHDKSAAQHGELVSFINTMQEGIKTELLAIDTFGKATAGDLAIALLDIEKFKTEILNSLTKTQGDVTELSEKVKESGDLAVDEVTARLESLESALYVSTAPEWFEQTQTEEVVDEVASLLANLNGGN